MKVIDFVKKINHDSDDIPVEIKCGISDTVAVDKSLWHYAAHCGIEADRKISSITICKKTHPSLYEYCMGGGEWQPNIKYDCTITDTRVWNPKEVWGPSNSGLGMAKIFDMINAIYGKDFIRYE